MSHAGAVAVIAGAASVVVRPRPRVAQLRVGEAAVAVQRPGSHTRAHAQPARPATCLIVLGNFSMQGAATAGANGAAAAAATRGTSQHTATHTRRRRASGGARVRTIMPHRLETARPHCRTRLHDRPELLRLAPPLTLPLFDLAAQRAVDRDALVAAATAQVLAVEGAPRKPRAAAAVAQSVDTHAWRSGAVVSGIPTWGGRGAASPHARTHTRT